MHTGASNNAGANKAVRPSIRLCGIMASVRVLLSFAKVLVHLAVALVYHAAHVSRTFCALTVGFWHICVFVSGGTALANDI